MVEDIITALSRFKSLLVIARNSSFTYKGRAVDIKQVGRELGVRYVLEGSVRRAGGRVRITGQLIEAATGTHLWADKIDGALEDVFDLQDAVTARVVGAIEPSITQAEINRAQVKPTSSLGAYDLYLRALSVHYSQLRSDVDEAVRLLEQAIALDPGYAWAKAFAAYIHVLRMSQGWVGRDELHDARTLAREALIFSHDEPNTLAYAAHALAWAAREYDVPVAAMDRAIQLNSSSANILVRSGALRTWISDADLAIDHLKRSMRLNPVDPQLGYHHVMLAVAYIMKGEYATAVECSRRATQEMPRWTPTWSMLAASLALAGRQGEASAAVRQVLAVSPTYSIALRAANSPFRDQWVNERIEQALRLAGLPES
jgi:adenylate cyclase